MVWVVSIGLALEVGIRFKHYKQIRIRQVSSCITLQPSELINLRFICAIMLEEIFLLLLLLLLLLPRLLLRVGVLLQRLKEVNDTSTSGLRVKAKLRDVELAAPQEPAQAVELLLELRRANELINVSFAFLRLRKKFSK